MTEQRYRAVLEVRAGVPVTEVAERYGVSPQRVHAWLRRYRDEGTSGLADRSHKVLQNPWQIPAGLESAVCELRRAHPKWGPTRLVFEMDRQGTVTRSTVYRVLISNGLIEPKSWAPQAAGLQAVGTPGRDAAVTARCHRERVPG